MKSIKSISLSAIVALGFSACGSSNEIEMSNLTLSEVKNLPNLGDNYVYEGWVIVDEKPISTGVFTVTDDNNTLSKSTFSIKKSNLENASKFVLSIEPKVDDDPKPSATKILVSEFSGTGMATIAGVITNDGGVTFSDVAGKYILATPSDDDVNSTNNEAGVWWIDPSSGTMEAGLTLPTLTSGWKYEGWAVIPDASNIGQNIAVSTGTFTVAAGADSSNMFSGTTNAAPGFPGEDFITPNADNNFTTPVDLRGKTIVISVEPSPDNSTGPFSIKPLVHPISATQVLGGSGLTTMTSVGDANNPSMMITR